MAFSAEIQVGLNISDVLAQIDAVETRLTALRREQVQAAQAGSSGLSTFSAAGVETTPAQRAAAQVAAIGTQIETEQAKLSGILDAAGRAYGAGVTDAAEAAREAASNMRAATKQSLFNASNEELLSATADLSVARRLEAATSRVAANNVALGSNAIGTGSILSTAALAEDPAVRAAQAESLARIQSQLLAADATLLDQVNIETVGREGFNTKLAEASVAELRSKAELALTTQNAIFAQNEADKAAGIDTVPQLQAATAYEQQFATLEEKNALLRLQLDSEEALVGLQNQNVVLQEQYNIAKKAQTEAALATARAAGILPPEEKAPGGGLGIISGGAAGLAKFALGAAAFVGVSAAVRDVLKETTAVQQQFSILKVQLDQTDHAGQFPTLTQGLFSISRDTGVATSDLAKLAIQIQGTFQGQAGRDSPDFILAQVHSAAEIQKVFGLSFQEIGNSVQALAFTFNKSFQDIGDRAAGLQSRFGVTAKELISSVSQIAPVANELGLNFNQLTAITAAAERETGRTGVSVTEALGRVLPNISQHTQDVLAVYQGNTRLAGSYQKIVEDLASGRTGDVLLQLIQDWSKLSQVQKDSLLVNLGGGRQAPQLAAVFGDPQLLGELNKPIEDAGKLAKQFKSLQNTLGQTLSEVKQDITQLGVALAQVGIVPFLTDFANAARTLLGVLRPLTDAIKDLSSQSGGVDVIGKLAEAALLVKGLSAFNAARSGGAGFGASTLSALTLGIKSPKVSTTEGAAAGATLGSKVGSTSAEQLGLFVNETQNSFTSKFKSVLNTALQNKLRIGAGGAGIALATAGSAIGGQSGDDLSSIGSGLLIGSATGSPIVGIVVGATQIISNYLQQAQDIKKKIETLASQYADLAQSGKGREQLAKIAQETQDKRGFVGGLLLGAPKEATPEAVAAQKALTTSAIKRSTDQLKAILGQLNPSDELAKQIKGTLSLQKTESSSTYSTYVTGYTQDLVDQVKKGLVRGVSLHKILNKGEAAFSAALASGNSDKITSTGSDLSSSLKQQFEAGDISYATYIQQLQSDIKGLRDVANRSKGGNRKQDLQTLGKLIAQRGKATSDFLKSQIDLSSQLRDISGSNTFSDADINQLASVLANPEFTDPGDRDAVLSEIISETRKKLQDEVNKLTTPAAKLARALQGEPLPAPAKLELARKYLDLALQGIGKVTTDLEQLATATGTSLPALENRIIELANAAGVSYSAAAKIVINQILLGLNVRLGALRAAQAAAKVIFGKKDKAIAETIAALKGEIKDATDAFNTFNTAPDIGVAPDPGNVGIDTSSLEGEAAKKEDDLAKRIAIAQAGYAEAVAALDPVAAAQAAIHTADVTASFAKDEAEWWDAQAQRVRAEQQLQQAQLAITKLAIQLAGANTADPVKQANTQIQLAYASFLNAHGAAESIQAQIDITSAMRSLAAATAQIIESQIGLAQAVAAAAGDSVGAARDALKSLQVQLLAAAQSDAGPAALTNIRAQIVAAQASIRDASLAERESTIDFNLQVQRISTGQAISEYQALLNQAEILGLTEAQRRDLILKIQNLKHTLTQDLQFDLPTDLKLPTLYEARRLGQSGGNYQDNRTVTITLNSTDPASTEAAVSQINDAMNAPAVYGGSGRIY